MIDIEVITPGTLHVITGGMKGHKTPALLYIFGNLQHTSKTTQLFKPECDYRKELHERYGHPRNYIVSRTGMALPAIEVDNKNPEDLLSKINLKTDVIGIGEVTLFEKGDTLVEIILRLLELGKGVVVDGLDRNFRGEPFHPMPTLLSYATTVQKFYGRCDVKDCNQKGEYPQRIIDGKPADYNSPLIVVGEYEIRCLKHHEVPGKPESNIKLITSS